MERVLAADAADASPDLAGPRDLLAQADTWQPEGAAALSGFAGRAFTYYTADEDTEASPTCWNAQGEDLEGTYGGTNRDETRFVRSETVKACCCS